MAVSDTVSVVSAAESAARRGDWPQAAAVARAHLQSGLRHPRLYQISAIEAEQSGRLEDAVTDFMAAHALDPGDPGVANGLATVALRLGRPALAREALEKSAARRPEIAETFVNLGVARTALGDPARAAAAFEAALRLNPQHLRALTNLALLALQRAEPETAERLAMKALAVRPRDPEALRARLEAIIDQRRLEEAEGVARDWLAQPDLSDGEKAQAEGLLGDALERLGRFDDAFAAFTASKQAFGAQHQGRFAPLLTEPLSRTLTDMAAELGRIPTGAMRSSPESSPARTHVFLMGFMRSGTTLLEQALTRHADVAALEETEALAEAGAAHLGRPGGLEAIAGMTGERLTDARQAYWRAVRSAGVEPDGKVFIDKHPFNAPKLPLIAHLFPDAKIVFALRDPRDVVVGCFKRRLRPNAFSFEMRTLEGTARLYAAMMQGAMAARERLDLAWLDHRHEELVVDLPAALRRVCDFVDLDFRQEMIAFGDAARAGRVVSMTARQLAGGVNREGVGRWRSYERHMEVALPILAPWIERFGYDRQSE